MVRGYYNSILRKTYCACSGTLVDIVFQPKMRRGFCLKAEAMLACRFEHVSCSVPGSRFNTAHWASVAHRRKPPAHGRPLTNGHDLNGHDKSIAVRFCPRSRASTREHRCLR